MGASTTHDSRYIVPANHNKWDPVPTTLTEAAYGRIVELAAEGNSLESIAGHLGISPRTFAEIRKRDDRARDAYTLGKAKLDTEITNMLLKSARDGSTAAQIFLAKGKLGWREVGPAADQPPSMQQVNIYVSEPLSDDQFAKLVNPERT